MSDEYSIRILIKLLLVELALQWLCLNNCARATTVTTSLISEEDDGVIRTITRKDSYGAEHVEYAFHAPSKGLPNHVIELFCASVKLRLYWDGYRSEVKESHRKGIYLRRMARFAKHVFKEIRDVDKPFNATMLSRVDKHLAAKFDQGEEKKEGSEDNDDDHDDDDDDDDDDEFEVDSDHPNHSMQSKIKGVKNKLTKKFVGKKSKHQNDDSTSSEILEEIDSSETIKDLTKQGQYSAIARIRKYAKSWKKVALWIYTRYRTMWWMTLSCLYAKYYLWDPALDEFTKLKRSLLMWPELQMVKLQDVQCKPVIFFRRIMDICKILNPLMKIDIGQFNYNSLSRFKADS